MSDLLSQLMALEDTPEVRERIIRAPFGYPGAKSRSIANLLPHLPYRNGFCEPCGGTGVVTFARRPSNLEVLNDRHMGITSFYRCLRDRHKMQQLMDRLHIMTPCSREEFIWARDTWEDNFLDDIERSARWYYSVIHSFNSKGWSFGRVTKGRAQCAKYYNNFTLFGPIHNRLQSVQIENLDWRILFKDYNSNDMVWYIDPPYWKTIGIYKHEWKELEHLELCERIQYLHGFVALSGYDSPDHPYNKFKWDDKISWEVQVSMTGMAFTDTNHLAGLEDVIKRGTAKETLWIRDFR